MELRIRFARKEADEALQLIGHLRSQHLQEPGVAEALTELLVQVGLLRPDGTPAASPPQAEPPAATTAPAPDPGKIWTPNGEEPGGEKKLWTPD